MLYQAIQAQSPAFWSSPDGQVVLFKALLGHVSNGQTSILRHMVLDYNIDINKLQSINASFSLLHQAVFQGHEETALFLIESGIDIHTDVNKGVLKVAIQKGMLSLVKCMVVKKHARGFSSTGDGHTMMCTAVKFGHLDIMQFLFEHIGRSMIDRPCYRKSLLVHAAEWDLPEVLRWAVNEAGTDPMERSEARKEANALHFCHHGQFPHLSDSDRGIQRTRGCTG